MVEFLLQIIDNLDVAFSVLLNRALAATPVILGGMPVPRFTSESAKVVADSCLAACGASSGVAGVCQKCVESRSERDGSRLQNGAVRGKARDHERHRKFQQRRQSRLRRTLCGQSAGKCQPPAGLDAHRGGNLGAWRAGALGSGVRELLEGSPPRRRVH